MNILKTENISKSIGTINILKDISISIEHGKSFALVGQSGAGKSSLLQIIGLLDHPTSGKLYFEDKETGPMNDNERTYLRRNSIGFVYQFHHLLPNFSALENVSMPLLIQGMPKNEAFERSKALLKEVELSHRLNHRAHELSGGEQQRVAIARAIVHDPKLLLADEPTGNLDSKNTDHVFHLLMTCVKQRKMSTIIATHNLDIAHKMDHILYIQDGMILD